MVAGEKCMPFAAIGYPEKGAATILYQNEQDLVWILDLWDTTGYV